MKLEISSLLYTLLGIAGLMGLTVLGLFAFSLSQEAGNGSFVYLAYLAGFAGVIPAMLIASAPGSRAARVKP